MDDEDSTTARTRLGSAAEIAEIRRLYAEGHVASALALAERVTARDRVPLDAVPVVIVTQEALLQLPLDHRGGFMLTCIDGVSKVRAILDIAGMSAAESLALLGTLETLGALRFVMDEEEKTIRRASYIPAGMEEESVTAEMEKPAVAMEEDTVQRTTGWPAGIPKNPDSETPPPMQWSATLREDEKTAQLDAPWLLNAMREQPVKPVPKAAPGWPAELGPDEKTEPFVMPHLDPMPSSTKPSSPSSPASPSRKKR